jgi:rhodanese-related sulfurtransferase
MMNKRSIGIILGLIVVIGLTMYIGFGMSSKETNKSAELQVVDTAKLTQMIIEKENMVIVDLREPELFAAGKVPGAINIPFEQIESKYTELPKDKKVVFVCHTGRMGVESGNLLLANGYMEVFNLEGGMEKWSGEMVK